MTNADEKPQSIIEGGTAKFEKAIADLTLAIKNGKDNAANYVQRATCFIKLSKFQKALDDAWEASSRGEKSMLLALIGGDAALNLAKMEDAYKFYKIGIKIDPNSPAMLERIQLLQQLILEDYELEGGM